MFFIFILLTSLLVIHAVLSIFQMIQGWENAEAIQKNIEVEQVYPEHFSFGLIVPARHEELVIYNTLKTLLCLNYKNKYWKIYVPIAADDISTISEVRRAQKLPNGSQIKLVIFPAAGKITKARGLNLALKEIKFDYVGVIDAEDEVHPELLNQVNSILLQEPKNVVLQVGVSLMNWHSGFLNIHPVLEYFFWFHSRVHWLAKQGIIALGGTGIFLPSKFLKKHRGWNEDCLTEDAYLGVILSAKDTPFRIFTNETYSLKEEVPPDLSSLVKQRTRWIQGFVQILNKFNWRELSLWKRIWFLSLYTYPILQTILYFWLIISLIFLPTLGIKSALFSFLPLSFLLFQIAIQVAGIFDMLAKRNQLKYFPLVVIQFLTSFVFYQFVLFISTLRAMTREVWGYSNWEKTPHENLHRSGA